jgi:HEAT repeat protein
MRVCSEGNRSVRSRSAVCRTLATKLAVVLGAVASVVGFLVVRCSSYDAPPPIPRDISLVLQNLIKGTLSKDVGERVAAARGLLMLRQDATPAIPFLVRLLGDEAKVDRGTPDEFAYTTLKDIGEPAIRPLLEYLPKSSLASQRKRIAELLGQSRGQQVVEPLITLLNDNNPKVRSTAAASLSTTRDPRSVEPLIARLRDADWDVRGSACLTLGHLGDPKAAEPLIKLLGDDNVEVRAFAAVALRKIPDSRSLHPLLAQLQHSNANLRRTASLALGSLKDARAIEPLIEVLKQDSDNSVRGSAAIALGKTGDARAVEPLIVALRDDKDKAPLLRYHSAVALGRLRDYRAFDVLLARTKGATSFVSGIDGIAAVLALGQLSDGRVAGPLAAIWQNDAESMGTRCAAAVSLGQTRDRRAMEAIAFALQNGDQELAAKAIECLAEKQNPEARKLLKGLLKHESKAVRKQAAIAIEKQELAEKLEEDARRDAMGEI